MITRWITLVFCALLSLGANLHASEEQSDFLASLTPAEQQWLESSSSLKMVYDPDWAPFEWQNNEGQHIGVISDIIASIRQKTGLNIEIIHTDTWAESVNLVKEGHADFFSAITVTPEREGYLHFSRNNIYSYPAVLLTQFSDATVYLDAQHDLKGKQIGIVKSSGLGEYIRASYPGLDYVEVPSTDAGFVQLREGQIDLFAINSLTGRYYIEKKGFESLKIALKLDYAYNLKIAVRNSLPIEVINILDKGLESITIEEINGIVKKWVEAPIEPEVDWLVTGKISLVLVLIILFFALFSRHLKKTVQLKTQELENKNEALEAALKELDFLREREKENIYRATVHSTQHILNNLLNQLSLLDIEINKHPEFDHTVYIEFKAMRLQAKELTEKLASVKKIEEDEIKKSVAPK